MSFTRIHIAAFLLVLGLCNAETTGSREIKVNDSDTVERNVADNVDDIPKVDVNSEKEAQDGIEEMLPILPPIILLDFDNDTNDDNTTGDEKSKRTVNNGLGYGFDRNSLHSPRKYNYYFPAGKTGTTVSIEESISPFLPRTIIEKVSPSNQKPVSSSFANVRQQRYRLDSSAGLNFPANYQSYRSASQPKSPLVFGLRTKLTKTSDSEPYQGGFVPIVGPSVDAYSNEDRESTYASTTPQSLTFSHNTESTAYATPSPQSYTTSGSNRYTYVTSSPLSYTGEEHSQRYLGQSSQHAINVQGYSRATQNVVKSSSTPNSLEAAAFLESIGIPSRVNSHDYVRSGSNVVGSSTSETDDASSYAEHDEQFANLPRYTVENGVRYENKIFWKYPNGKVSDVPPMTYETYSYPQAAKSQETQIYESTSTENSAQSQQGPVQFPMSPEPSAPSQPTSFISAETLSSLPQQQVYRLRYQNLVNQKQIIPQQIKTGSGISSSYSASSPTSSSTRNSFKLNEKSQKTRYETASRRPILKYMINSPNPEYLPYTTESTLRDTTPSNPFFVSDVHKSKRRELSRDGFVSSGSKHSAKKTNVDNKNLENYSNLQYADLLNYNPSISQYIKNPASILNVQPTFVQAGSSLIPVIILRVDGVPPIQPKAAPNVNLKALLQQYLVQYARSIEELARPSTYDLGNDDISKDQHSFSTSLRELARLAQNNDGHDLLGNPTEAYISKTSYETSNLEAEKNPLSGKYGERTSTRPKVKSVQILEDPRFPNYRVKN